MFETRLLVMLAETPVHAGTGAELGAVDLPVQRERHTRYPTIHGSGVKGVLRDLCEAQNGADARVTLDLFGSRPPEAAGGESLEAGSLAVGDARLLLLPVRSAGNVFAWTTCPYLLGRLCRDMKGAGRKAEADALRDVSPGNDTALVPKGYPLDAVLLEEFEIRHEKNGKADRVAELIQKLLPDDEATAYWRNLVPHNLVILPDDIFADLAMHGTEVVTRVRLTDEKTVQAGALWTEEYVPTDTLFYSVVGLQKARLARKWESRGSQEEGADGWAWIKKLVEEHPVAQFGGKETIGRGFLRLRLWP